MHPYGCRVVQRALEHANATQCRRLLNEVLKNTCTLVEVCVREGGREGETERERGRETETE